MASILVVDDDLAICEGMKAVLTNAGHDVRTAPDGQVALELLSQGPADLAICDIMMPEVDGFEFYRRLKAQHPGVKFIAISGYSYNGKMDLLAMAEAMGAEKAFQKPVMPRDLLAAIDALH